MRRIRAGLKRSPIVALLGPRQCGKTTLAREFLPAESANYFDLQDPAVAAVLEQPMTALQSLRGLVVIDEAQRQPGIFPVLRVLADRAGEPCACPTNPRQQICLPGGAAFQPPWLTRAGIR
ncbi:MAG: hypothetical protein EXS37_10740 [Opitutus sp.]|nr:hypothetical protein [Opitutus sp.]